MFIECLEDQINSPNQDPGSPRKKDKMQNFTTTSNTGNPLPAVQISSLKVKGLLEHLPNPHFS